MDAIQILMPGSKQLERNESLRVVGIGLGTTNSTIAEVRLQSGGAAPKVRCVEVEQRALEGTYAYVLFPSVVAIHGERVWVGEGATRLRSRASLGVVGFFRPACGGAQDDRGDGKRVGEPLGYPTW